MSINKRTCPVPFEQQPLNEYFALKSSFCFGWSTLAINEYIIKIIYIFCISFLIFFPLICIIINNYNFLWKAFLLNCLTVNLLLILVFTRLYLGWSYVMKRLVSATIFYEESGWYDGQIWIKNLDMLTKDRLVGLYEVMPFIDRIQYSLIVFIVFLLINILLFWLL
uniref:Hypothetical chloroplast RF36 n=1 Tax=Gastroclonium compressum TaxID=1852973 RepID=A0A173G036_GASCM|nr:hypothetical chloroplast RF36 [Coeloseira compressa]ANH09638.1 hypothetical chloroplast RF36 [Coeloseira compressa]